MHRAPAHVKILAMLLFVVAVVATPREQVWAFGAHLVVLLLAVAWSGIPVRHLLPRMAVEIPFVCFALLMPLVATGPRVDVGPLSLSEPGLWGAWAILAKATLGTLASVLLASTTEPADIVEGLARLRVPGQLVQIIGFMIRYATVVGGQLRQMRIARESRGFVGRSWRTWSALSGTLGALFVRSYERGERVHLSMLSRGYTGRGTTRAVDAVPGGVWAGALVLPAAALIVLLAARAPL